MKRTSFFLWLLLAALVCAGCASRWKPVNHFTEATREIPLQQAYVFQAMPLDRTLKAMLGRWATDTGMVLVYQHPSDFTLHKPVAEIRTTRLADALRQLEAAYGERLLLTVEANAIAVRDVRAARHAALPQSPAGH